MNEPLQRSVFRYLYLLIFYKVRGNYILLFQTEKMAVRKTEFNLAESADELLNKLYKKDLAKESLDQHQQSTMNYLVQWDLARLWLFDNYQITPKGKTVYKRGGVKATHDQIVEMKLQERKARKKRRVRNVLSGFMAIINNTWVQGIGVTVIGGLILYLILKEVP